MKAISIIAYKRPQYLRQVLDSLFKCNGVAQWAFFFNLEPGCAEVAQLAREFLLSGMLPGMITLNPQRLGHTLNFYQTFARPFEAGADYVAMVEEDTPVARDFLLWHEFASEKFRDDSSVFTVAGGHYGVKGKINPDELSLYDFHNAFHNKGWGTWRDRWFEPGGMHEVWENPDEITADGLRTNYKYHGYEGCIERVHIKGRRQVFPVVTRVKDIGEEGGTHCTPGVYKELVEIQDWADNYDLSEIQYHERSK